MSEDQRPKHARFGTNLLLGMSITKAAAAAGISRQTAYRLLRNPLFQFGFEHARREVYSQAITEICISQRNSIKTLRQLLDSDNESIRLRAAQALTRLGERDQQALPERLTILQRQIKDMPDDGYPEDDSDQEPGAREEEKGARGEERGASEDSTNAQIPENRVLHGDYFPEGRW